MEGVKDTKTMRVETSSIGTRQCITSAGPLGMRSMFGKISGGRISTSGTVPPYSITLSRPTRTA